ncbi:MAG TPA: NAD-dependent epimerase/dehydratase family protein [Salinarimonas sp.]|jgi:UDP-glucuronate 4-epimerase|nr:NAD-dependent epimerase/dehydratase family protein [Salinarimonas sp.]
MRFLVTGTAGFIGFHLARRLLAEGHEVVGVDAMTPYYDVALKRRRQAILNQTGGFATHDFAVEEGTRFEELVGETRPDIVVHLAAQAGVRYSVENPRAYLDANVAGTFAVLQACRAHPVRHLLIASTSSAYGVNPDIPFRETDRAATPVSLYAATKLAAEHMAHAYAHLFAIPTTAFRFFTVYGPWGRPDMAPYIFARKVLAGETIEVFNEGRSERDFTYVDDLVEGIMRLVPCIPPRPGEGEPVEGDSLSPAAAFRVVNIGGGRPVSVNALVAAIEAATGRTARRVDKPMPPGDVVRTFASADLLEALTGYRPATPLSVGIPAFVAWYREHHGV